MRKLVSLVGAFGASAALLAASNTFAQDRTIVETAVGADDFETLVTAVQAAELVDALSSEGPFTVFAPTDAAFAELPQNALRNTINNEPTGRLADILKYHVVAGRITADQLATRRFVTTLDGQRLEVGLSGGLSVNDASIVAADIECSNGVIHVIDAVLIPAKDSVPAVADKAGDFNTLLAAARTAGLVDFLNNTDPITVFAPTDEAFAELPDGTVEALLLPENRDQLRAILAYHVVQGARVYSTGVLAGAEPATVAGPTLEITSSGGTVRVNDATVIAADIDASNGVIHVIDSVLIPPAAMSQSASSGGAGEVLTLAINRGVPLFNDHQPGACAAIYEIAITSVLRLGTDLPVDARQALRSGLSEGLNQRDATERAWTFRRAIDTALESLAGQGDRMTRTN